MALDGLREDGRGDGGLILVDWRGWLGFAASTPLMPVGWCLPRTTGPDPWGGLGEQRGSLPPKVN